MSSGVRVVYNGLPALHSAIGCLPAAFNERAAEAIAQAIREKITTGARSGVVYGGHQASAPGEPPADDTGALVESVVVDGRQVRVESDYGPMLEYGTSRMAPRPFFHEAVDEEWPRQVAALYASIRAYTNGIGRGPAGALIELLTPEK